MEYKPILTKSDFVRRFSDSEFGNRGPMWNSLAEWLQDFFLTENRVSDDRLYHIRNIVAGAMTWYNVLGKDLGRMWGLASTQFDPKQLYLAEMAPAHLTILQGEVRYMDRHDYTGGLDLYYSTLKMTMREALATSSKQVSGIIASQLLHSVMDYHSYEWIQELLVRYPDHVIEFSVYGKNWGTIPNRNTIIWEVRSSIGTNIPTYY